MSSHSSCLFVPLYLLKCVMTQSQNILIITRNVLCLISDKASSDLKLEFSPTHTRHQIVEHVTTLLMCGPF